MGLFSFSLAPAIEIGSIWPPAGIEPFNPWGVPLLNTFILLLSGLTITYAHHALMVGDAVYVRDGFLFTILLAVSFTALQAYEYVEAPFNISDGIYGSTFYMATGFQRFPRYNRYNFYYCFVFASSSIYTRAYGWFRSSRLVLAFCGCRLVVSFCNNLLVGQPIIKHAQWT